MALAGRIVALPAMSSVPPFGSVTPWVSSSGSETDSTPTFSTVRVNWADLPSAEIVIVASPMAIADTRPSSLTDAIIGFDEL